MVGQVADPAGVLADTEVGRQVGGADDRLGLEGHGGRGHPGHRAQRPGQLVHLRLVLAVGAQPLPQERDRVEPEHLDAHVGQGQDDVGELAQHGGVRPVEVPLVVVERRPHPRVELVVEGEVAGREVGEDLRQRGLVGIGHRAVLVDVEVGAPVAVAGAGGRGPGVLTGHVVEHQVEAQADALGAQRRGERAQVVDVTEVGAHGAVVHDGVAAVVGCRPGRQQRHQVEVAHPEVAEVRRPLADPTEGAGEAVGVGGVADHRGSLEPVRLTQPQVVERAQVVGALGVGRAQRSRRGGRRRRARRRRTPAGGCRGGRAGGPRAGRRSPGRDPGHGRSRGWRGRAVRWRRVVARGSVGPARHGPGTLSRTGARRSRCRTRGRARGRS